jgi:tRNA threonylcarbamoyladenosine biosynthesis protein TsaB
MLTLGLDTSEPLGGIALYEEEGLAEERWMEQPLRHAEGLFPLIDRTLKEFKIDRRVIDSVSVHRGPGSFTGLRIGLAAAKGLCQAWDVPLVGVDGTWLHRARVPEADRLCVVLSSRRDLFYVRWFVGRRPKGPTSLMQEDELIGRLMNVQREVTLTGSGAARIHARLGDATNVRRVAEALDRTSPLWVARLGRSEKASDRLYTLEPLYVEPLLA